MIQFNIYFGTIGTGAQYQYTMYFENEEEAKKEAYKKAATYYYRNAGDFHIPGKAEIEKEVKITGLDISTLFQEHIKDIMRWYAIPTKLDSISSKDLIKK